MGVRTGLEEYRDRLVNAAETVITEFWAATNQIAVERKELQRYGLRLRDERATGRTVRIVWAQLIWKKKEFVKPGEAKRFMQDLPVPPDGRYKPMSFRKAEGWELELVMAAEQKLIPIRLGLKMVGELMMRLPALEQTMARVEQPADTERP